MSDIRSTRRRRQCRSSLKTANVTPVEDGIDNNDDDDDVDDPPVATAPRCTVQRQADTRAGVYSSAGN